MCFPTCLFFGSCRSRCERQPSLKFAFLFYWHPWSLFFSTHPEKNMCAIQRFLRRNDGKRRQQYVLCIYSENSPFCCLANLCFTYVRNTEEKQEKNIFPQSTRRRTFFFSGFVSLSHSFLFLHSFHSFLASCERPPKNMYVYIFVFYYFFNKNP